MSGFTQDLRHAVRALWNTPAFTAVAVVTLALGIGANSAIFSFADATLLRSLPFHDPDQLMMVSESPNRTGRTRVAFLNFVDWRRENRTFDSMAAVTSAAVTMQSSDGTPEQIPAQSVTTDFFRVFRVAPVIGRTFAAEDDGPQPAVAVLGERFWRSRFGGEPGIVGRSLTLNGRAFRVLGVVPARFQIFQESHIWVLFSAPSDAPFLRRARFFDVVGRLKPDVTLEMARADIAAVAAGISASSPETNKGWTAVVDPLRDRAIGDELSTTAWVLAAVVLCVLLIACANVAGILVTRGMQHHREIAIRAALGAERHRLLRASLTESLVIAVIGGSLGLGLCALILQSAQAFIPQGLLPTSVRLSFDIRIVMFCILVTAAVALVSGLMPAWQAMRVSLIEAMAAGTRGTTAHSAVFRQMLTVFQIAAAVLLLCGAGLLLRTLTSLTSVDAGHRADRVLTMRVTLPTARYDGHDRMLRFHERVEDELNAIPGIRAAVGTSLPLDGTFFGQPFEIVGDPPADPSRRPIAFYEMVSWRFLGTMGIAVVRGRGFDQQDTRNSAPVCLVSEEFVRQYLSGREPVGMQIRIPTMTLGQMETVTREIVGVVRQVRRNPGESQPPPQVYVPITQNAWFAASLVVKPVSGEPEAVLPVVRKAVANIDPLLPLARVRTLDDIAAEATARPRFRAQLVGAFAGLALVLAMGGLFGLMAFSVHQRMREFGIRVAVGGHISDIARLVLSGTARVTLLGVVMGLAAAAALGRFLRGLLFGVEPLDLTTFATVAAVVVLTALCASLAPVLRAARVDPLVALRYE